MRCWFHREQLCGASSGGVGKGTRLPIIATQIIEQFADHVGQYILRCGLMNVFFNLRFSLGDVSNRLTLLPADFC